MPLMTTPKVRLMAVAIVVAPGESSTPPRPGGGALPPSQ